MHWYLDVLKKYVVFEGRARRTEYWVFNLVSFVISLILSVMDNAFGISFLAAAYGLLVLLPSLAVTIRRLHDTNRSGWWFLICIVPLIGWVVLLVFMLMDSDPQTNQYGPNPKYLET